MDPSPSPAGHVRRLSTFDGIAIVLGIVIGSGIFALPSLVAANTPDPATLLGLWLLGGIVGAIGALCYAELATAYPDEGGDYHFLRRAYGRDIGFLFVWGRMTVIQTGALAAAAFIAGNYLSELLPLGKNSPTLYAAIIVVGLTALNLTGLHAAKWTQNLLATLIIIGLLAVAAAGFSLASFATPAVETAAGTRPWTGSIGLALIFVLFTYGGWNEAAYLSAEIKEPRRNITRVLLFGIGIVAFVYLVVNAALVAGLGMEGMAGSSAVAAEVARRAWGQPGAVGITLLVVIAVLSTVNATIITGGRSNYALGRDYPRVFGFLSKWNRTSGVPSSALLLQAGITLALILLVPLFFSSDGLEAMVAYTAPVFWFFFFLTGLSVVVLRRRDPHAHRPFRVPLFPVLPLLFCCVCLYMLYSAIAYAGAGSLVGVAVVIAGVPFLLAARTRPVSALVSKQQPESPQP